MKKLFIANRGEIARRIIRTARDMGVETVVAYVDADADSPYVGEADQAYRLLGDSYLDGDELLKVALRANADAVHPGYGFLSERASFASLVIEAGLAWVGPKPDVIAAMGDKIEARRLAESAGVPVLPASQSISDIEAVGFPVLVKASAGGGGKGMRIVHEPRLLEDAVAAARREAKAAFGDETIFLERYVAVSRHIEIQILGDEFGALVHLGERECSIQRRHQKVIEESPAAHLHPETRDAMAQSALQLGRALGYSSAGTVEFLVEENEDPGTPQRYYFLEVNTRLQVEHPVTEAVTGLDLVREQLRIATGEPLGYDQSAIVQAGHAVEARIYAEDPANDFLPAIGTLVGWKPNTDRIRWDSGVEEGYVLGTQFDPMVAKVIAHAPTRTEASLRLARALADSQIAGVTTNREFLVETLRHPTFLAGDTTTDFIARVNPSPRVLPDGTQVRDAAVAAIFWLSATRQRSHRALEFMRPGWRNSCMGPQRASFGHDDTVVAISYTAQRDGSFVLGEGSVVRVRHADDQAITLEIDGALIRARLARLGDQLFVDLRGGQVVLTERSPFPKKESSLSSGAVLAPMPGAILNVLVEEGDRVEKGQLLAIMEAMKMEHRLVAGASGVVRAVPVTAGDQVESKTLLVDVESVAGDAQ
jgi:propionyl-CoA carboxylase alpha chain